MIKKTNINIAVIAALILTISACKTPILPDLPTRQSMPIAYNNDIADSSNIASIQWKNYFDDPYLQVLIDSALTNNQEMKIMLQEIEISKNEIMARRGEYLPFVSYRAGMGVDKVARYTSRGASEATTEIKPGKEMPDPLPDFMGGLYATWEVDIWHKLRNAQKSAFKKYLASQEAKNFMVTNLIAEIANSYYELLALDNQLTIVKQNINIQSNALDIVKIQKEASRVTELAVKKFEAEVLSTKSLQFAIEQNIIETENRINYLVGRYPQPIQRAVDILSRNLPVVANIGLPQQLIENRPDVRQALLNLEASKINVEVAKANFYPSLGLSGSLGLQAFNPLYFAKLPGSILSSVVGDLMGPLVNKKAITATYFNANAMQVQAIYEFERTVLGAYVEVVNQYSKIQNLEKSYGFKSQEVNALIQSISISNDLFKSARADYMEVLLTQRDALETRFELVETKVQQMNAYVNVYRALGGGWK